MLNPRSIKFIVRSCVLGTAALGLACSGTSPGDAASAGEPTQSVEQKEIATVTGAGVTLRFYAEPSADGLSSVVLLESGSAYASSSPVPALVAQGLTSQEIYLAFAPAGSTAPAELVQAQAAEAAAIGRSADLRHVAIDTGAVVEKSLTACSANIFVDISSWAGPGTWTPTIAASAKGISNRHIPETTSAIAMGACNEATIANVALTGSIVGDEPGGQTLNLSFTVPPGGYGVWRYRHVVGGPCNMDVCPNGEVWPQGFCTTAFSPVEFPDCLTVARGATYSISAISSGPFDIATGIWK